MLRLVFMGNTSFGAPVLQALAQDPTVQIVSVYTSPPRPRGRGHKILPGPIHLLAEQLRLPVHTPLSLRSEAELVHLKALRPDMVIVAAYGLILPASILEIPPFGCVNLHASLLPRWRGASPIHHAIWAGDTESGLSIMAMEEGLDTGPTFRMISVPIEAGETSQTLHHKLACLSAEVFPAMLSHIPQLTLTPQRQEDILYAPKISRDTARLIWDRPAFELERQIRAFDTSPKAWTTWNEQTLKIGSARVVEVHAPQNLPGTLMAPPLKIMCGEGTILEILTLQKADGRMIDATSFLRGFSLPLGSVFV